MDLQSRLSYQVKKTENVFCFKRIEKSDKDVNFYTGLKNAKVFLWVVKRIEKHVTIVHKKLSLPDHVLIVLMKIKLVLLHQDIGYRFNVKAATISQIWRTFVPVIAKCLKNFIAWPDLGAVRRTLPKCFEKKFPDCICIIDCSKIFIERPKNLTARAQTLSNYKHNYTIKYLVGVTPAGLVSFLSSGWGGCISDQPITLQSGFLKKFTFGDLVLADMGFNLHDEIALAGAVLKIPCFTKGKSQLSQCEVDTSRQLSNVRIHVERVNGRLKKF